MTNSGADGGLKRPGPWTGWILTLGVHMVYFP